MTDMPKQVHDHLTANFNISKKDIIIGNFIGGVSWGFGTVVGATIVAAIIISTLKSIGVFQGFTDMFPDPSEVKQEFKESQDQK